MADISSIQLEDNIYNIKDKTARQLIDNLNQDKLIVFGDSWSDLSVTDSIWSPLVANNLNLTLHNYAVNGATFIANPNKLISSQVQAFSNNNSINKSKVKYIVVMGGVNDYLNGITDTILKNAIASILLNLQNLCPNAKLLYVSNCGYPYTFTQSQFWYNVHNWLSANILVSSLNLDGIIGNTLYNTANYFHLTQNGQKWLGKQIIAVLTGGQVTNFQDSRVFYSANADLTYTALRIGSIVSISIFVNTKTSLTSIDFDFPNDIALPYYGQSVGGGGRALNKIQYGTASNALAVRFENPTPNTNASYYVSWVVPLYSSIN